MKCPTCNGATRVLETREARRRRCCETCSARFWTEEQIVEALPNGRPPKTAERPRVTAETTKKVYAERAKAKVEARRRVEEIKERKSSAWSAYDDYDFIPEKW